MFGLVKASRLRKAEDDHVVAAEALRHAEDRIANLETESETWEKLYFAQFRDTNNLRAVAESRLVAVLLLRERYSTLTKDVDTSTKALLRANSDLTSQRDDALQENARLQQCWTTQRIVAEHAHRRTGCNAIANGTQIPHIERDNVSKAYNQLSAEDACTSNISWKRNSHPPIETAIIRPSSTNRLAMAGQR